MGMANPADISTLAEESLDLLDDTIALRRRLHEWPELGNHLPKTREEVLAALGTSSRYHIARNDVRNCCLT